MPFSLSSSALNDYQRYLSLLVGNAAYVDTVPLTVDYLVIAGGGGGSLGGGGAGGYRTSAGTSGGPSSAESSLSLTASTNYTVTVGAGGTGGQSQATSGGDSVFATITSLGGGGGAALAAAANGGSGGGAADFGRGGRIGTGTSGQGNDGGQGTTDNATWTSGGGGGGASQTGATTTTSAGGDGGDGIASSITGSSVTRGGGGGGGAQQSGAAAGIGGTGGGGNGGSNAGAGTPGTVNTGGGAGGGTGNGVAGGSGLVVVKYPIAYDMTVGAGLGYKTVMSGDYKITEFTSGTGTVSFALAPTVVGSGEDILQEIVLEESTSSVTFANLDQYASTYQHLQIRFVARTDRASSLDSVQVQFNGDTSANYSFHNLQGSGSGTPTSAAGTNTVRIPLAYTPGATNTSNAFALGVADILDPFETTKYTTVRSLSGQTDSNWTLINLWSGNWRNLNAVTEMRLHSDNATNYVAGSRFTLIGVK